MFKTKIVLNIDKIINEGKDFLEMKNQVKEICKIEHLTEESKNLYVLDEGEDNLGARLMLLCRMKKAGILPYLIEWKTYDDEESPNGELEEGDMLQAGRKRGQI